MYYKFLNISNNVKNNLLSVIPGIFIIKKNKDNSDLDGENKIWINPVPDPVKNVLNSGNNVQGYDWSNVKKWEEDRINASKFRNSFEDKKYNSDFVKYLNNKIRKEENEEWKSNPLDFLWKACEKKGINPNNISILSSRNGNIRFKHKDYIFNKNDRTFQFLERNFNSIFDMNLSKIASGYECQVYKYLKKEGISVIDKNSLNYEEIKLDIDKGNITSMDNVSNLVNNRKRSNSCMSIDENNILSD